MKTKFIKNKKADVPITILVIMIVAICILTILSFLTSRARVQSSPLGIELIEEINSDVEKFYFYLNLNAEFSEDEAADQIDAVIENGQLKINRNKMDGKERIILVQYIMNIER
jgi:hypothetical protein